MQILLFAQILIYVLDNLYAFSDLNYDDTTSQTTNISDYQEFVPITAYSRNLDRILPKNINCDDFSSYAINCTIDAGVIYNSSRMSPPSTANIHQWCKAIRFLTNCAIDWNTDCKDVTDSHFRDESVKGHIHVVNNICDDEWFLIRYEYAQECIESSTNLWETCYLSFKRVIEEQKNLTYEWTHYQVHFQLCCARVSFRRCTLDSLFLSTTKCSHEQAIILQKFSIIVSEGGVYQNCDHDIQYKNCPGGDPRPSTALLNRLMSSNGRAATLHACLRITTFILVTLFLIIC